MDDLKMATKFHDENRKSTNVHTYIFIGKLELLVRNYSYLKLELILYEYIVSLTIYYIH